MKAITYDRFGPPDVLRVTEIPKPEPKADEILIKVHATTVTSGDWRARTKNVPGGFALIAPLVFGFSKPRQPILGSQLSGHIEAVGRDVCNFKVGDRVFAYTGVKLGCYVEYKCLPQNSAIAHTPEGLRDDQAAALPFGGATALVFLRKGKVKAGDDLLVNGASGLVGSAAVQLANQFGARVTAVCSTNNLDLVKSLSPDSVIDYTKQDFTTTGMKYDLIVDTAGTAPFERSRSALKPHGRLLEIVGTLSEILKMPWVALTSDKRIIAGPVSGTGEDLRFLAGLAASGQCIPLIDRSFRFEQMADAHRYLEAGHKRGNIIITI